VQQSEQFNGIIIVSPHEREQWCWMGRLILTTKRRLDYYSAMEVRAQMCGVQEISEGISQYYYA
jgi:hypothetical protein